MKIKNSFTRLQWDCSFFQIWVLCWHRLFLNVEVGKFLAGCHELTIEAVQCKKWGCLTFNFYPRIWFDRVLPANSGHWRSPIGGLFSLLCRGIGGHPKRTCSAPSDVHKSRAIHSGIRPEHNDLSSENPDDFRGKKLPKFSKTIHYLRPSSILNFDRHPTW